MKKIVRPKKTIGLKDNLRAMEINSTCEISFNDYKSSVIRSTVYKLNKEERFNFSITEKGLINSIKVTRLR